MRRGTGTRQYTYETKRGTIVADGPINGQKVGRAHTLHVLRGRSPMIGRSIKSKPSKLERGRKELLKKRPNVARGVKLIKEAFKDGDPVAAYALVTWYLFGEHLPKDWVKAVQLLKVAASSNVPEALYDLAVCYEGGAGTRKSPKKAYECYLRAALWGDQQSVLRSVGASFTALA
jgi:uncharacterized protein